MYYQVFFGGFIRIEANVCFVTIMKVDYQPTRCFCNYQAYGCLVFCCVFSKFVFAIFSTLYVNIKRSQQTERNVNLVTVMKVEYKPTGCLSKLQACTYSVFCSVLLVESLYSYLRLEKKSIHKISFPIKNKIFEICEQRGQWQHNFKTPPTEPTFTFVKVNLENIS